MGGAGSKTGADRTEDIKISSSSPAVLFIDQKWHIV
jgi:hypothetical protein